MAIEALDGKRITIELGLPKFIFKIIFKKK
jgi:hypothetical protein